MNEEIRLSSTEANVRLDSVRGEFEAWHFNWGYDFSFASGAHSWKAGCKYGYWMAFPEEFERVEKLMDEMRSKIESLEIVSEVEVWEYPGEEIALDCGDEDYSEFKGEIWRIEFSRSVDYDHRGDR